MSEALLVSVCAWCMQGTPAAERPKGPDVSHGACLSHAALVRIQNGLPLPRSPVATWLAAFRAAHDAIITGQPGAIAQARAAETLRPKYAGAGGAASVLSNGDLSIEGRWTKGQLPELVTWLREIHETST